MIMIGFKMATLPLDLLSLSWPPRPESAQWVVGGPTM
jgi:hypothetical protein